MLNQVNKGLYKANRQLTLRHPNSLDVSVHEKQVVERDQQPNFAELGDDGIGILTPQRDEAEYEYVAKGIAKMLPLGRMDRASHSDFGILTYSGNEITAYIEPYDESDFQPAKHDMVVWHLIEGQEIAYEIKDVLSPNYFPENRLYVYVLQPMEQTLEFDD